MAYTPVRFNCDLTNWELFKNKFPNRASEMIRNYISIELNIFTPFDEPKTLDELDELKEEADTKKIQLQKDSSEYNKLILNVSKLEKEKEIKMKEFEKSEEERLKQKAWLRKQHHETFMRLRFSDNVKVEDL